MKSIGFKAIGKLIEKYDSIVIYRHTNPDYDAFGSQLGLKHLIQSNYLDKKVYTYGDEMMDNEEFLGKMDFNQKQVDLDIIRNSLTVLVDTSTDERADDKGACYKDGKCSLKIDHHEKSELTADYGYIDPKASSASYIITKIAFENNWEITKDAAQYLFGGMNTDTRGFTIDSVKKETFETAAKLMDSGFDLPYVCRQIADKKIEEFKAENYYRENAVFKDNLAYFYSTIEERNNPDMKISEGEAKDLVNIFACIRGIDNYACFIEKDDEPNFYSVSLRSHKFDIRKIAVNYGSPKIGGGHEKASGIGRVSFEDTESIIKDLLELKIKK